MTFSWWILLFLWLIFFPKINLQKFQKGWFYNNCVEDIYSAYCWWGFLVWSQPLPQVSVTHRPLSHEKILHHKFTSRRNYTVEAEIMHIIVKDWILLRFLLYLLSALSIYAEKCIFLLPTWRVHINIGPRCLVENIFVLSEWLNEWNQSNLEAKSTCGTISEVFHWL